MRVVRPVRLVRPVRPLGHNVAVSDIKQRITDLAKLMSEFQLSEAKLESETWKIAFRKHPPAPASSASGAAASEGHAVVVAPIEPPKPKGTPVTSPMNGVFYAAPNPGAPPFVHEGDQVTTGQVVGLIEAMKVFNEIVAPISGTVGAFAAENGVLVQPGEPLLYIE